jgi:TPR repeat protein
MLEEARAQYEVGCAYFRGTGVVRNLRLALRWLRAAARAGHQEARAFLERIERGGALN